MTPSIVEPPPAGRSQLIRRAIALSPLWLLVTTAIGSNAVAAVLALEMGLLTEFAALLWMLGGVAIVWKARSPLAESLAYLVFTIPAAVVAVVAPLVILAL